jgi:exodeoxyribonuclease-5
VRKSKKTEAAPAIEPVGFEPVEFDLDETREKLARKFHDKLEGKSAGGQKSEIKKLGVEDLSPDQREAYSAIKAWLNRGVGTKQTLSLGGFAGTGKSTVISVLAHELLEQGNVAFAAFTGKASSVLGRKLRESGISTVNRISGKNPPMGRIPYCGTVHGLMYTPCEACMTEQVFEHNMGAKCRAEGAAGAKQEKAGAEVAWRERLHVMGYDTILDPCRACDPPPPIKREGPCKRCRDARFFRREALDRNYGLLVIDEASMISDDLLQDLKTFNVPILAVGDHGQLPPVRGTGSLMKSPDLRLEKIHRQAEGNPIIALSAHIRENGDVSEEFDDSDHVLFLSRRRLADWIASRFPASRLEADPNTPEGIMNTILISWTNKQRCGLNDQVRATMGISGEPIKRGEVVIALKNKAPVYNGMRGILLADGIRAGTKECPQWKTDVHFVEDDLVSKNVCMAEAQFFGEKTIDYDIAQEMGVSLGKLGELYDLGYALTCHKSQGSQAPEVAVLMAGIQSMAVRDRTSWAYTAVTRASSKLVIVR